VASRNACIAGIVKYWPEKYWTNAIHIMMLESGGNPNAHLYSDITHDDSWSCFQVNRYGKLAYSRPSAKLLLNPDYNAKYAYQIFQNSGYRAWYNSSIKLHLINQ
jgi:hypothetical protein